MSDFTIIALDTIDSTNNYAMRLIDANKAHHGMAIIAQSQTAGKGQRGKTWMDKPGASLLMSLIISPDREVAEQFVFNSAVAAAIAKVLQNLCWNQPVYIKWPNDIIIDDKKAGGILIENLLRGHTWTHSIVGIGINVQQEQFPDELPFAISLKTATGSDTDIRQLAGDLCEGILLHTSPHVSPNAIMEAYNGLLYRRGQRQTFRDSSGTWEATIINAHPDGRLEVQRKDGAIAFYHHGQAEWVWEQPHFY